MHAVNALMFAAFGSFLGSPPVLMFHSHYRVLPGCDEERGRAQRRCGDRAGPTKRDGAGTEGGTCRQ